MAAVHTAVAARIAPAVGIAASARTASVVRIAPAAPAAAHIAAAGRILVAEAEPPSAHLAPVVAEAPGQPLYPSNPGIRRRPAALRGHTADKST